MRRLLSTLIVLLGLSGLTSGFALADSPVDGPRVLVLGDSISAAYNMPTESGWVALLNDRLASTVNGQAINASISGDTTAGGLNRLPDALARHQPDFVIIALGGNDGLRGISLAELRNNLTGMINLARTHGAEPVLAGVRLPSNYGIAFVNRFLGIFAEVAETTETALVPMILASVAEERDLMQEDGIHPNATAQPIILETVWAALAPLLELEPQSAPTASVPSS